MKLITTLVIVATIGLITSVVLNIIVHNQLRGFVKECSNAGGYVVEANSFYQCTVTSINKF